MEHWSRKIAAVLLAVSLLAAGCAKPPRQEPTLEDPTREQTAPVPSQTEETAEDTEAATTEATSESTAATQPEDTQPPATKPVQTDPPETQPKPTDPPETQPPETTAPPQAIQQEAQVLQQGEAAVPVQTTAQAPGTLVKNCAEATIDYSNTDDGYVMVRYDQPTDRRLKAQVKGPSTTYTYNLTPQQWSALPLSDENGDYQITIYINVVDSKYAAVLSHSISIQLQDDFGPFLYSNQYVNFDAAPNTVATAASLCGGTTDPLAKVTEIYHYVIGNISYDYELAATVTSGYLPVLDNVLASGKGICFDYAALMTGMLRSQGVPTKLVIGYAGDVYHAWINVWSESTGWVDGVIFFDGTSWQRMDPTFASSGASGGSNYSAKYFY